MNVLAIDPGNEYSAWCRYDGTRPVEFAKDTNEELVFQLGFIQPDSLHLAIEYMEPRGMPTSAQEMDTQFWAGRLVQAAGADWTPIKRREVKIHLCGSMKAKDANIRQSLIDKFGGDDAAIGGKKCPRCKGKGWFGAGRPTCTECGGRKWLHPPGPLYGIAKDVWSALAIAVTWYEKHNQHRIVTGGGGNDDDDRTNERSADQRTN